MEATSTKRTLERYRTGTKGRAIDLSSDLQLRPGRFAGTLGGDCGRLVGRYCAAGGFISRVADRTGAALLAR
ncbi:MAG: hypothetical protein ACJ73L_06425 [Actinomycetes bacterium]